jgi:hypothetical protein
MTGTLLIKLRTTISEVTVGKVKYEIYEDEWDMLQALQKHYGCLSWRNTNTEDRWVFRAELNEDYGTEYFIAEFKPNNQ